MRSKYSNVIVLLVAILAFAPLGLVEYLLDGYIRHRETTRLERAVEALGATIEQNAGDGIASLQRILANSPSLCTPTFIANVRQEMQRSLSLRQVLVENTLGTQYCDAFGAGVAYRTLSHPLPIPGHSETVTLVRLDGLDVPLLKVSEAFGAERIISSFVPVFAESPGRLLASHPPAASLRISLTDGTPVLSVGDPVPLDTADELDRPDYVAVDALAGEMPLRVSGGVAFSDLRQLYGSLSLSFTLLAGCMSAALLLLMLHYVRRANPPAFDLERGILLGEIKPYYQPVINLRTGRLAGCEMLCRWEKRNGEIVPPGVFIEHAEQTGLAIPMTLRLMQQVRADLGDLCGEMPDIKVSINLFEGHFRDVSIVSDVQAIFGGSPISFSQLTFEITERRPIGNSGQAKEVIAGLHRLGAKLAMDDVGTGHSNLAYLQTLGFDVIKIDRIFVDMIQPETTQVPVLDGLIAVGHDLGTEIIAEGVETAAQATYLRDRGVTMAQGYLFAPALRAKSFRELAHALNAPPEARSDSTEPAGAIASAA
ncbi:MAG TPA: EAL domain-containing protein [Devosiaceae bacterium]|nr:EAL domain-containing protein [Devosiaceae bacterium]